MGDALGERNGQLSVPTLDRQQTTSIQITAWFASAFVAVAAATLLNANPAVVAIACTVLLIIAGAVAALWIFQRAWRRLVFAAYVVATATTILLVHSSEVLSPLDARIGLLVVGAVVLFIIALLSSARSVQRFERSASHAICLAGASGALLGYVHVWYIPRGLFAERELGELEAVSIAAGALFSAIVALYAASHAKRHGSPGVVSPLITIATFVATVDIAVALLKLGQILMIIIVGTALGGS
jgi:hypothetical protein